MNYHAPSGYGAYATGPGMPSGYRSEARDRTPSKPVRPSFPAPLKKPDWDPLTPSDFPKPIKRKFPDMHKPPMPKPPKSAARGYV